MIRHQLVQWILLPGGLTAGRPAVGVGVRRAAAAARARRPPWPTSRTSPTGASVLNGLRAGGRAGRRDHRGTAERGGDRLRRPVAGPVPATPRPCAPSSSTIWPTGRSSATRSTRCSATCGTVGPSWLSPPATTCRSPIDNASPDRADTHRGGAPRPVHPRGPLRRPARRSAAAGSSREPRTPPSCPALPRRAGRRHRAGSGPQAAPLQRGAAAQDLIRPFGGGRHPRRCPLRPGRLPRPAVPRGAQAVPAGPRSRRKAELENALDFHHHLSILGDHPALLRGLGLVIDLEIRARLRPAHRATPTRPPCCG